MGAGKFVRFAAVGFANTMTGLAVIWLGKGLFGFGDVAANALGYGVGLCVSFFGNRHWTFRHEGRTAGAVMRFLAVVAVAYGANLVCVLAAIGSGIDAYAAQAIGVPVYALIVYWGSAVFAFRG